MTANHRQDLRYIAEAVTDIEEFIGKALCQSAGKELVMDFKYKVLPQKNGSTKFAIQVVIQNGEEGKEGAK